LLEFASANPSIAAVNHNVSENRKGWSLIKIQIDSGAIDHAMPPSMAPGIKIRPTAGSIAGKGYPAANGAKIANHGEETFTGITESGAPSSMNVQYADVTHALGFVYRLNKGGDSVILNGKDSYMLHVKSGIKAPSHWKVGGICCVSGSRMLPREHRRGQQRERHSGVSGQLLECPEKPTRAGQMQERASGSAHAATYPEV
jgi:hypothetical protein